MEFKKFSLKICTTFCILIEFVTCDFNITSSVIGDQRHGCTRKNCSNRRIDHGRVETHDCKLSQIELVFGNYKEKSKTYDIGTRRRFIVECFTLANFGLDVEKFKKTRNITDAENILEFDTRSILDISLNFSLLTRFSTVRFANLIGFDVNSTFLLDPSYSNHKYTLIQGYMTIFIQFTESKLEFYSNKTPIRTCQDYLRANLSKTRSFFQIKKTTQTQLIYLTVDLHRANRPICPLLFGNMDIHTFQISNMADTFYKTNLVSFKSDARIGRFSSNIRRIDLP